MVVVTVLVSAPLTNSQEDVFSILDVNHDGLLDKQEYQQGISKFQAFFHQPLTTNSSSSSSSSWIPTIGVVGFWSAFTSAVCMILATEIGDKTFFIAAVLSMKHDRWAVFVGAISALVLMTILSTIMGLVLPTILPKSYTHILGGILFLYFGVKLILESQSMEIGKASEELEEVEEELLQGSNKKEEDEDDAEMGGINNHNHNNAMTMSKKKWYQVLVQALTLTFVAEWGDRSQIATIALAAAKNPYGVTLGGCVGHCICTGIACVGGRMLAARISEKTVHQYGGVIFLLFGIHSLFFEE